MSSSSLDLLEGESGPFLVMGKAFASSWRGEHGPDQQRAIDAGDGCHEDQPVATIAVGEGRALVLSDALAGDLMPTAWLFDGDEIVFARLLTAAHDDAVLEAIGRAPRQDTGLTLDLGDTFVILEAWETLDQIAEEELSRRSGCAGGTYRVEAGSLLGGEVELIVVRLVPGG